MFLLSGLDFVNSVAPFKPDYKIDELANDSNIVYMEAVLQFKIFNDKLPYQQAVRRIIHIP